MNSPNTIATRTHHFRRSPGGAAVVEGVVSSVLAIRILLQLPWGVLALEPLSSE